MTDEPRGISLDNAPQGTESQREPLITADAVAAMLSVPTTWVYGAARNGVLPVVHVGRHVRFKRHEIDAWIDDGGAEPL